MELVAASPQGPVVRAVRLELTSNPYARVVQVAGAGSSGSVTSPTCPVAVRSVTPTSRLAAS